MRQTIAILIIWLLISSVFSITGCKGKGTSEEAKISTEKDEDETKIADVIKKNISEEKPEEVSMIEGIEKDPEKESGPDY